jgi:hypothetical protein
MIPNSIISSKTPTAQLRIIIETLREGGRESSTVRDKVNTFLGTYKSTASLEECFRDVKDARIERADSLDELILKLSFETHIRAAIVFLEDASEWVKTVGILKSENSPDYTIIDTTTDARIHVCKNLDFEVEKHLKEPVADFGYIIVFFKETNIESKTDSKTESKRNVEKEEVVEVVAKKRHKPIAKRRGGVSVDMTSEESTNK